MDHDDREPQYQPPRRLWAVLITVLTILVCVSILIGSWDQIAALF
ncbi:hypothetical protein [Corynebacterium sp. 335C]